MNLRSTLLFIFIVPLTFCKHVEKRHGEEQQHFVCDDGKNGIEIDLHGESDWKCYENSKWPESSNDKIDTRCYKQERAYHVCIDRPIEELYKSEIPHSGPHREVWAKYGEYKYLPPGRYVHNLEHGGVVFMYHPCAPTEMVNKLREVATSCLRRYLLTTFPKLTKEFPFAVLTYGCIFRMSKVDPDKIKVWVRQQFGKSPESDVYGNGEYTYGLLTPAIEPIEFDGDDFCPDTEEEYTTQSNNFAMTRENFWPNGPTEPQDIDDVKEKTFYDQSQGDSRKMQDTKEPNPDAHYKIASTTAKASELIPQTPTEPQTQSVVKNNKKVVLTKSDTSSFFWIVISVVCFVFGLMLGVCTTKFGTGNAGNNVKKLRVWNDSHNPDSFSIAAVVRKIPDAFNKNRGQNESYHRLEANENSSDEENVV